MHRVMILAGMLLPGALALGGDAPPKPMTSGLVSPASIAVGLDGRIYISDVGEAGKEGDGRVVVVDKSVFARLESPAPARDRRGGVAGRDLCRHEPDGLHPEQPDVVRAG